MLCRNYPTQTLNPCAHECKRQASALATNPAFCKGFESWTVCYFKHQSTTQPHVTYCKDVVLYNTRKRYAVIESSNHTRNIFWLASCFSKKKKPNKHCSGNQSVIPGVCIIDTISYIYP
jgi:hypothetical protein